MSIHHGLRSAAGASVADPDFKNVSLLLLGNGTNGGQNNTFVDDSSNAFSVTRYGNTTQGTFSPFGYNWSNYFDGSGDDLRLSSSSAFSLGTGDFTFEAWINPANWTNTAIPFFVVTATGGLWIGKNGSNFVVRAFGVADQLTYSTMPTVGTWTHIIAVRSGTTLSLYYDGSRVATTTNSYSFAQGGLAIGSDADSYSTAYYTGHLSNVRLVKGTAVYDPTQTTLSVPTAPLTAITNTSLLTCQSNRFLDNSSNAFAITPYGNAAVTNFAPFPTNSEYSTGVNGGSGYFDGSGDYLSVPSDSAFNFGTGDFTVEAWIYPLSLSSPQYQTIFGGNYGEFAFYTNNQNLEIGSWYVSGVAVTSGNKLSNNTWKHIAVTRSGSTLRVFIDGTIEATATNSSNFTFAGSPRTGASSYSTNFAYFNGFISSFRILKGTAQYTANFTPSTSPLSNITNTSLLLNFTNASIIDSTGKNDLETVGDAQISTSVKKFGTGALKFDGTGDYLLIPDSDDLHFGSGDFTAECWVYPTASPNQPIIMGQWSGSTGSTTLSWVIILSNNSSRFLRFALSANGSGVLTDSISSSALTLNDWNHIALVRSGNVFTAYLNGTSAVTYTITAGTALYNANNQISVGASSSGISPFQGYIDDLRITKGVARYTANFTPPSRQLPAR